jgi:hypothetical protein
MIVIGCDLLTLGNTADEPAASIKLCRPQGMEQVIYSVLDTAQ